MKMERTQNATRNIIFGIALKIYQILIPFIMRTIMLYSMGVQYLGLNSLFTSILQVLNLAELGVGSAMVYSMYKPIAEDDEKTICALLRLYKRYYFIVGLCIAVCGAVCTPFIPKLISGNVPNELNVYILFLLNLAATVFSYWMFAYQSSILMAYQRVDITSKITLVINSIQYFLQVVVLFILKNYYLYLVISLTAQICVNIATSVLVSKYFPNLRPEGKLPKEKVKDINQRIRDLFTAKFGATVVNSADTIVIAAFLGLSTLAIYQNYYFIMSSVMGIVAVIFGACLAGIGNSMVVENIDKNYVDFRKISFLMNWIITIAVCCFACLYQPFMELWVGREYMFDMSIVSILCVYFYLVIIQQVIGMYKDAAGMWHKDRLRPLIAAAVNLALNLILVKKWGVYAIILSTVVSYLVVAMPWLIHNVFKYVFKRDWKPYTKELIKYISTATIIAIICYLSCQLIPLKSNIGKLILYGIICISLSNFLLLFFYRSNKFFAPALDLLNKITKGKFYKGFSALKKD